MVSPSIEFEFAVVRGGDYVYRSVLLGPGLFSIGTHSLAVLSMASSHLPEYYELVSLSEDRARLSFDSRMAVEISTGSGFRPASVLVEEGKAVSFGEGWAYEMGPGSKALARFGPIQLLMKVRDWRGRTVVDVPVEGELPSCGHCGSALRWVLDGRGVLTPCSECRALNRVLGVRARMLEGEPTATAPSNQSFVDQMDEDLEDTVADDLNPVLLGDIESGSIDRVTSSESGVAGANLPTFDAMSSLPDLEQSSDSGSASSLGPKESPPFETGEFRPTEPISVRGNALPGLGPQEEDAGEDEALTQARERSENSGASGLPTFDAISALKETEHLSTVAAMDAMREEEEPVLTDFFEVVDAELPGDASQGEEAANDVGFQQQEVGPSIGLAAADDELVELDLDDSRADSDFLFGGNSVSDEIFSPDTIPGKLSPGEESLATGSFSTLEEFGDPTLADGVLPDDGSETGLVRPPEVSGASAEAKESASVQEEEAASPSPWVGEGEEPEEGDGDAFFFGEGSSQQASPLRPNSGRSLYVFGVVSGILGIGLLLAAYLRA